jgi:hypothetical protein
VFSSFLTSSAPGFPIPDARRCTPGVQNVLFGKTLPAPVNHTSGTGTDTVSFSNAMIVDPHPKSLYPNMPLAEASEIAKNPFAAQEKEAEKNLVNQTWDFSSTFDPMGVSNP